jgi:heme-degrading monooxygenase HmoA
MVHILVNHKVADFNRWKETFDGHLTTRKSAGEIECRLFQSVEDPRDVTLLLDWDSVEHARRFMNSDELRSAMQQAGVLGTPEVKFVQDAAFVHRSSAD